MTVEKQELMTVRASLREQRYLEKYRSQMKTARLQADWAAKFRTVLNELNRNSKIVAEEIGFSKESVFDVTTGTNTPSFSMLCDMVRYLHVNPDWLFYVNPENTSVLSDTKRKRDDSANIAERVKQLMDGCSINSVIRTAHVNYSTMKRLLSYDKVGEPVIHRLADTYHVGFEWLLCNDADARENPVTKEMTDWLGTHPAVRKDVWKEMSESYAVPGDYFMQKEVKDQYSSDHEAVSHDVINLKQTGERIRQLRQSTGCSVRDFEAITGVSKSTISNWENAKAKPDGFALRRISETLNIGSEWILYGDELYKYYPCDKRMIEFLKQQPGLRAEIVSQM